MKIDANVEKQIRNAVEKAILDMGVDRFRKTSFFLSNQRVQEVKDAA